MNKNISQYFKNKYQALVLISCLFAVVVVGLGAYTRLSDAGLGCPDWPGCYGFLTVPKHLDDFSMVEQNFPGAVVESGKAWKEMIHRYFAGTLGLMLLGIMLYSIYLFKNKSLNSAKFQKHITPLKLPIFLVLLVIFQAILGMLTVTMALQPLIVMGHLLGGFAILTLSSLLYFRITSKPITGENTSVIGYFSWCIFALVVLLIQIALGGWLAANYAAPHCVGLPLCSGNWQQTFSLLDVFQLPSPSSNYEYGLLVKGFEDSPRLMMTYNPPYYEKLILNYGFQETKRLFAYKVDAQKAIQNDKLKRGAAIAIKRNDVTIRKLSKKNLSEEMKIIKSVYNAAWEANYGHIPFTDREMDQLGKDLKLIASEDLLLFAEIDGKVIGKGLAIPDLYAIQKEMNGKLFPFNFLKLFTKRKTIKWVRVLTLGIIPEYRNKGIDALLSYELLKAAVNQGILYGEGSWVLEDNLMMWFFLV